MNARFVNRTVTALLVAAMSLAATAAAGAQGLPMIDRQQAVPLGTRGDASTNVTAPTLAVGQRGFAPVGAVLSETVDALTGTATLRGTVATIRPSGLLTPFPGLTAHWWLDDTVEGPAATTADDGTYLLANVPAATSNGTVTVSGTRGGYSKADFTLGHSGLTWPADAESVYDFTVNESTVTVVPGGPWSDWTEGSVGLWGYGPYGDTFCGTDFTPRFDSPGSSFDALLYVMPGRYDQGAVYWYANQGLEMPEPLRVAPAMYEVDDVFFLDSDHGWLLVADVGIGGLGSRILRTSDGGRSWSSATMPVDVELSGFDFADASAGCSVGSYSYIEDFTSYEVASIWTTQDGGATWVERTSPVTALLDAVDFSDALHGCAVGDGGAIITTDDGGATWTERVSGVTWEMRDVCFTDASHGWACGMGGILATSDGGATWTPQGPEALAVGVSSIDTEDGVHIVAGTVGSGMGALLHSADGGATWDGVPAPDSDPVASVDLADGATGWAVTYNAGIAKTTDGGATWSTQRTPVQYSRRLFSVSAIDGAHAWAVGKGWVTDTTDGEVWAQPRVTADQASAQRFTASGKLGASGNPGSPVKLTLSQFPKGWVSDILGEPDYPVSAVERRLGGYTSQGGTTERKTIAIPKTAKPGYFYWFALGHTTGPLYLYAPFQVSLLKAGDTSLSRGSSTKLSGVIPTQGHWGSTPGKVKRVALFKSTVSATKGFRFVKYKRADGYGKFNLGTVSPTRTTWYIVLYPGDKTYWEDVTSAVKVTVR